MIQNSTARLNWDFGTGYDLFISLSAIHNPDRFNLRASWAAGVRSRLSHEERQILETSQIVFPVPVLFVYETEKPKDAKAVLKKLEGTLESKRLEILCFRPNTPEPFREVLCGTTAKRKWTSAEKNLVSETIQGFRRRTMTPTQIELLYNSWANREKFGHDYLQALKAYVESFFFEEEQRILPVLKRGLSHAQMRAGSLPLSAMLEELSSGVRFAELANVSKLYLAPSFWCAPFLFYENLPSDQMIMLFGARPDDMALIPGDIIPDNLMRGLKALSDQTRLRILRTLAQNPQTAAQLSRTLRLRPPTVTHHLMQLRLAGMVQVTITTEGERKYAARFEGFEANQDLLTRFIRGD